MGANNSTCLPCRVSGGNSRRSKGVSDVQNDKKSDKQANLLKKVSTAAEPQGGSRLAGQVCPPTGSPNTGAGVSSSQSLHGRTEIPQQQHSLQSQEEQDPLLQPLESRHLRQAAPGDGQQAQPSLEEATQQEQREEGSAVFGSPSHLGEGPLAPQETTEPMPPMEQQTNREALNRQHHIHIPSHMLASEIEASWQQQHGSQQTLLSPHSCSVAHRVAAALRAAAGERAAAAAARAAEAVEAAKLSPKESVGPCSELGTRQDASPSSSLEARGLRMISGSTGDNTIEQASHQQDQVRPFSHKSCFPHVPCFSTSDDRGDEITVRENLQQRHEAADSSQSDYFVVSAAKRVGEMLSTAAAAAASMASSAAGGKASADEEECAIAPNDQWISGNADRQDRRLVARTSNEKSGELSESAAAFLGAIDRAMDTINSDDFKQQAVTLLSQSVSVAASLVEAVKTCGEAPHTQGAFLPVQPVRGLEVTGCAPDMGGYYEALRMSAQRQLSEGTAHLQLCA